MAIIWTRPRLRTTPRRVALAYVCSIAFAASASAIASGITGRGPFDGIEDLTGASRAGASALMGASVAALFGPILWFILHMRGAGRIWAAALAALTMGAGAFVTLRPIGGAASATLSDTFAASLTIAVIAALSAILVWTIAYPRKLQPAPVADHF